MSNSENYKYDVNSPKAEEFINDGEIKETLEYAKENKNNRELIESILKKAKEKKGLSHREAAVLLDCELEDLNEEIFGLGAGDQAEAFYGNRIVHVRAPVPLQLLRQRLRLLSVPP